MWPPEWLIEKYLETRDLVGGSFDKDEIVKQWNVDRNYAGVALHQMRNTLLLDRVGRGRYSPVPLEKWVSICSFALQHPQIRDEFRELLRDMVNEVEVVIFYGSRARGEKDKLSDWDLLLVVKSRKARDKMRLKLEQIYEKNPRFIPEVLSLKDVNLAMSESPLFLKLVAREGKVVFDGAGIVKQIEIAKVSKGHLLRELKIAKENILKGMARCSDKIFRPAESCYFIFRGVHKVGLVNLAMDSAISSEALSREVDLAFSEFGGLKQVYRAFKINRRKAELPKEKIEKLITRAIAYWECTAEKVKKWGRKTG